MTNKRGSRREFLKIGGTGLAGAALLGAAGCGGGGQEAETNSSSPGDPTTPAP